MDKFKKIRTEITKQQNRRDPLKTRYTKEIKIEVLRLKEELGLGYSQTARAVGVTPRSIQNWCNDKSLKIERAAPKKVQFKKLPVTKSKPECSSVVLELKSGAKVHGLSLNELLQVIKDEAS